MYSNFFKPLFDKTIALFILIIALFILGLLIFLQLLFNNGQVFFIQQRTGLNGKTFNIIKFKTMTDECDENGKLKSDNERITSWGKFLRKWSLDELPQLWNILKGDMSMIGPRPLPIAYDMYYSAFQNKRHQIKPGLTGLAQATYRNNTSWPARFALDVYYAENCNLLLDVHIVRLTFKSLFASNSCKLGNYPMPVFNGND